ncbi:hypothetical protein JX265_004558 [Neoarthrinium moseri]|uniref:Uncharacterized protein n=1 Tax=Neoarthrinium moseri TaxID=1658444 RepID=A0A9Q0ANV1_9PEZI|nr:uncharacterized protein JN550_008122 [Neoarthrinium moseri]KAI1851026.1 hypothetical protein JX266_003691 [Neoarthrinium moseri]KAI1865864.1 hypothetical protein JN550_008122 [Neoarthrinium moseri]KAI1875500.1 hypothetical protein JX265_004558 [Neoarthrinium moseri]
MKSAIIAAAALATVAMAQPHGPHRRHHHEKRELVVEWETVYETVTVEIDESATNTYFPAAKTEAASASGSPGQFFQAGTSTTSVAAPPTSTAEPVVEPTTYQAPAPEPTTSTTPVAEPSTTYAAPPVESTTTAAAPAPTTTAGSGGSSGSAKSGKMTYYTVGLGSCGWDDAGDDDTMNIVAMGAGVWDAISSLTSYGLNQPAHPLCGQEITITAANGKSTTGIIRDKCPGCPTPDSIDVSEKIFLDLMGSTTAGVVDVTWSYNSFSG